MKIYILPIILSGSICTAAAQVSFQGATEQVVEVVPEKSTGLDRIYVLSSLQGASINYVSTKGNAVKWYSYKESGSMAEELNDITVNGNNSTLSDIRPDCGYIIEDGAERVYFWVVDYERHVLDLRSINIPSEQDCGVATLEIDADCNAITYYSITGVPKQLSRDIQIAYNTLEWDAENKTYASVENTSTEETLTERIVIPAPLCNTIFTIKGDRFLQTWGREQIIESPEYVTQTVEVQVDAVQEMRDNPNEQKVETESLGGSAPAEITFTAYCTDAVIHKEWQFSDDPEFSNLSLRLNDESCSYTFRENGTTYVRFVGSNNDGTCEAVSETLTVNIGESNLQCPNAFSPNASEGVNDEWKVSYKSIVSFKCSIFDRYGNRVCTFDDPAMGWDGKYKGKFVKPGVYYYVISAKGADGKDYNLKGDINILKSGK